MPCETRAPAAARSDRSSARQSAASPGFSEHERAIRALLFGDVKGFGKLREPQLPVFQKEVMGSLGAVLDYYGSDVLHRNTWGDGLFVVTSDVPVAAQLALDLQEAMGAIDPRESNPRQSKEKVRLSLICAFERGPQIRRAKRRDVPVKPRG